MKKPPQPHPSTLSHSGIGVQLTAAPSDRLPAALEKLSANGLGRLAVVDHDRLAGYLSLKDVLHVLAVSTSSDGGTRFSSERARS